MGRRRKWGSRRARGRIRWNKAVIGFTAALLLIFAGTQVSKYLWIWAAGPNTGFRSAGLTSGHYERSYPAMLRGTPLIGQAFVGAGSRLVIEYGLGVEAGKVAFAVWRWPSPINEPRPIGPRPITGDSEGRLEFVAPSSGLYRIFMHAHGLQGQVRVAWHTEAASPRQQAGAEAVTPAGHGG